MSALVQMLYLLWSQATERAEVCCCISSTLYDCHVRQYVIVHFMMKFSMWEIVVSYDF